LLLIANPSLSPHAYSTGDDVMAIAIAGRRRVAGTILLAHPIPIQVFNMGVFDAGLIPLT
jgi:hypothetical protein